MGTETVIFRGSPSLLTRFGSLFWAAALLIAGGSLAIYFSQPLYWILSAVGLIIAIAVVIKTRSIVYELTSERLRLRCGILTRRTDEMELYRVRDITLVEPFFLRMAGRGHIEITTMDPTNPRLTLEAIPRAAEVREQLRTSAEECRTRKGVRVTEFSEDSPATTPPPSAP
ncbi:MAG TPA: PH domain-containing protein [Methylomirabilota bacterium]|nr:PH domain-containing protein [Methylomirabilota bacterium]